MRAAQNTQNNNIPKLHYLTLRSNLFLMLETAEFHIQGDELRAFRNPGPQG
jgi:hypothetical protein